MSEWTKLVNAVAPKIAAQRAREMALDLEVALAILKLRTNYRRRKARAKKARG